MIAEIGKNRGYLRQGSFTRLGMGFSSPYQGFAMGGGKSCFFVITKWSLTPARRGRYAARRRPSGSKWARPAWAEAVAGRTSHWANAATSVRVRCPRVPVNLPIGSENPQPLGLAPPTRSHPERGSSRWLMWGHRLWPGQSHPVGCSRCY